MLHVLHVPADLRQASADAIGVLLIAVATAVILAALAFEHVGGYTPCALCLQQRYAYYGGIPALAGALALLHARNARAAAAVFLLVGAGFAINAGLGVYQAGAEWKLWEIPSCGAAGGMPRFDLDNLDLHKAPICGVANWRFLGLSFAGWNVVVSALLAAGALAAALEAWRRAR
jgi:disulfide bond formation protein DsbB